MIFLLCDLDRFTTGPPPSKPKPFVNPLLKDSEVRTVPLKATQVVKEPLYSVTEGHVLPRPPYRVSLVLLIS